MKAISLQKLRDCFAGRKYRFGRSGEYGITMAGTLEERKRAWAMVYRMYRDKGYAAPDPDGLWYGLYDVLPCTRTFIATRDEGDIATLTTVLDSEYGLPADNLYKDELDILRGKGRRLCEIISLASEEKDSRRALDVLKHLFKVALVMANKMSDATDFVITVNPHHTGYYEKRLLFVRQGEIRSYGKVGGAPAVFMVLDLETLPECYAAQYGMEEGSLAHHFTDEKSVSDTIMFLSSGIRADNRTELLNWFLLKRPAIFEKINHFDSPFDLVREQRACAADRHVQAEAGVAYA